MGQVPAATRTLRVLRFLASQPEPTSIDRIMRACGLPRSTAYHLLTAMAANAAPTPPAPTRRIFMGSLSVVEVLVRIGG